MIRFVVDRNLGRLAKWLRTIGFDAFYEAGCTLERLREESERPETIFLTTSDRVAEKICPRNFLIVPRDDLRGQLNGVIRQFEIDWKARLFTRCVICNSLVEPVPKEQLSTKVPERVFAIHSSFTRCPRCLRIYWTGTHTERLTSRLRLLLEGSTGEMDAGG